MPQLDVPGHWVLVSILGIIAVLLPGYLFKDKSPQPVGAVGPLVAFVLALTSFPEVSRILLWVAAGMAATLYVGGLVVSTRHDDLLHIAAAMVGTFGGPTCAVVPWTADVPLWVLAVTIVVGALVMLTRRRGDQEGRPRTNTT